MRSPVQRHLITAAIAILIAFLGNVASGALNRDVLRLKAQSRYGANGVEVVADWLRMIDRAQGQPAAVRLMRINEFFNIRTTFQSDDEVWQQNDYWATPLELLVRGSGDCEDFAIAKYVSLIAVGIPRSQLRLIYVRARLGGDLGPAQAHMVLGYYEQADGEPKILDNLVGEIQPASARPDLTPVFSFNGEGLWAGGIKAASDPTERLSRWRDLLARLRDEGFQ